MIKEAKDHFKICEKQVRRVFEILRLEATPNDTYSIDIYKNILKARLKIPYEVYQLQNYFYIKITYFCFFRNVKCR